MTARCSCRWRYPEPTPMHGNARVESTMASETEYDVVIIGAGIAGLTAAVSLADIGLRVHVFERDSDVGGRIRSDVVDGFTIDRGFQVYLTAYPRTGNLLDLDALHLQRFESGALTWTGQGFAEVVDPIRHPSVLGRAIRSVVGTWLDKLRLLRLRQRLGQFSIEEIFDRPESTTADALQHNGFSESFQQRFLRPFLAGIFLDPALEVSSRMFEFVFRMFSSGDAAVPAEGMKGIPKQLAGRLGTDAISTSTTVRSIESIDGYVVLDCGGRIVIAKSAIVAARGVEVEGGTHEAGATAQWRSCITLSYDAPCSPVNRPILMINGTGQGLVNHVACMSDVAPSYAPPGRALLSVTLIGESTLPDQQLDERCREELATWFPSEPVQGWRLLRVDRIREALPADALMTADPQPTEVAPNIFLAGDYLATPSIEGAVSSGLAAARAAAASLSSERPIPRLPAGSPSFERRFLVRAPQNAVAQFHEGPGAFARLQPPFSGTKLLRAESLAAGSITEFEMGFSPLVIHWVARHSDVSPGSGFTDTMVSGPMRSWQHRHEYRWLGPAVTEVSDRIWFVHHSGVRGLLSRALFNRVTLEILFYYRALTTRRAMRSGRTQGPVGT